ncbi:uncharacterized protein ARMOST_13933 [Armillaria ostoyae]|uniref:Uncharacterized protein n=1 Tax=Armillaria ostoyae TaxID=47428 RepID=A0A284RP46_ARMOS|nr:uncharacterized protein ARMOST_13933 [Armillaria ostoyae]
MSEFMITRSVAEDIDNKVVTGTEVEDIKVMGEIGVIFVPASDIEYAYLDNGISDGLFTGIDLSATYSVSSAAVLTEDDGVPNENSVPGRGFPFGSFPGDLSSSTIEESTTYFFHDGIDNDAHVLVNFDY